VGFRRHAIQKSYRDSHLALVSIAKGLECESLLSRFELCVPVAKAPASWAYSIRFAPRDYSSVALSTMTYSLLPTKLCSRRWAATLLLGSLLLCYRGCSHLMNTCETSSTDPSKHLGPFRVQRLLEHASGRISDEQCVRCGTNVRRVLPNQNEEQQARAASLRRESPSQPPRG